MQQKYYELRHLPSTNPQATLAADIARHMQTRQYLGTTLVICDQPHPTLSAIRKQWLRMARYLQKQRASTLNAEEILRLTHAIMHMQNMQFVARSPIDVPDAAVFFVRPGEFESIPYSCFTVYLAAPLPAKNLKALFAGLPQDALVVNYDVGESLSKLGLQPKSKLDHRVNEEWEQIVAFLQRHQISPAQLVVGSSLQFAAMDNALDTLLGVSNDFLRQAAGFQRIINLAQPLAKMSAERQKMFEAVTRLAHRVQALTPGTFNSYLIKTFGDKQAETFFLRDIASELYADLEYETLALES